MKLIQKILQEYNIEKLDIPSKSEPGKKHKVKLFKNGEIRCDCPKSVFRQGECRHIKEGKKFWNEKFGWMYNL